jgi:hypothetical protein
MGKSGSNYRWGSKRRPKLLSLSLAPGVFGNTGMTVFNGTAPSIATVLSLARDEAHWWCMAGAKGLSLLIARGF